MGKEGEVGMVSDERTENGMNCFGAWLKFALNEANMSQRELAKIMKTDEGYISKIIHGKLIPSGTTIMKLLDIFNAHIVIVQNERLPI
jgi:transcriptional regulator with XRE-family HTH domain